MEKLSEQNLADRNPSVRRINAKKDLLFNNVELICIFSFRVCGLDWRST
jgi:hypothetical protein